jgi:fluoride exporter
MFELPALPYLLVAIGGAVGSVLRYAAAILFGARPLTTFAVNILGSFLIGLLASISYEPRTRLLFGTGVLGGFTTFSAWQLEALTSWHTEAAPVQAGVILLGSLSAGFVACWLGYALGQRLR